MYLTTFRFGDTFVLTDEQGRTVATIKMRQRKGQNQVGIDAPGLKITKRQEPQNEDKENGTKPTH